GNYDLSFIRHKKSYSDEKTHLDQKADDVGN
ncbi:MAG: hypothetical protein ACI82I_002965, partial [Gammaproteobacteria bacterium]